MRSLRSCGIILLSLLTCGEPAPDPEGPPPPVPPEAPSVALTVRDGDDLRPLPSRVLIRAVPPTRRPDFRTDGATTVKLAPGVVGDPEGVMLITGEAVVPLPPGTYDLRIYQGPEYERADRRVTIPERQQVKLDVTLEHTVRTDGWLAADMHIHSSRSYDSKLQASYRVVSEVTAGVEVIVPTEHVNHNDLQPQVRELGYTRRAVSIPGSEYGFRDGHIGVFPVTFEPDARLFGAPDWEEWPWTHVDPVMYFPLIHALPGQPVIVINHPRLPPDLGYFRNIGWRPGQRLATAPLFEGMEILSGYEHSPAQVTALLTDWFSLLGQGHRIAGLGNSDTHRLDLLRAGYPRTWLRLATDEPMRVLPADLRAGLLAMRAIASNGPFVDITVDGKGVGETVAVRGGKVRVRVTADAASWIDLTRLQLYRTGALVKEVPITRRAHPALSQELEVEVPGDGWLLAMAVGDLPLPVEVIGSIAAGQARPLGVTNPVWLDADGDGQVQPAPGQPRPQPWGVQRLPEPPPGAELLLPLHTPLHCEPQFYY